MKKAYMYTRVSTAMQIDNYSIEAQRTRIMGQAALEKISIVGEYSDEGHSGKNISGRPAFQEMLADIEARKDKIDYVLVFKLSRFGRNTADAINSLQLLQDYGIELYCVEDNIKSSNAYSKLMFAVMASMAELERENIIAQTMSGRKQKAKLGGWNGGFAPYGYDLVEGELVIREDEAKVIRDLFKIYVETDLGANGTAKKLNEMYVKKARQNGYLTRFSANFVKAVVKNPVYKGTIAFGRRHTAPVEGKRNEYHVLWQTDDSEIIYAVGKHEAIVSEDIWQAAYDKYKELSVKKEKIDKAHEYILSGLIRCPDCGAPMYGIPNGSKKKLSKDGTPYRPSYSYKCRNQSRESGHECPSHTQYSATKLDAAVRDIIFDMIHQDKFKERIDELIGLKTDTEKIKEQIHDQEKEQRRLGLVVARIEAQLDELDYDNEEALEMEESLTKRLAGQLKLIKAGEEKILKLNNIILQVGQSDAAKASIYHFMEVFTEVYDQLPDKDKKDIMHAMIDRIELYPRDGKAKGGQWIKEIHFTIPMSYHGEVVERLEFDKDGQIFQPQRTTDETVVLLSKLQADQHVEINLDLNELDLTAAESKATYDQIKAYVQKIFGLRVTSLQIAQTKRKLGLPTGEHYNLSQKEYQVIPQCPPEKESAIRESLRHFRMT